MVLCGTPQINASEIFILYYTIMSFVLNLFIGTISDFGRVSEFSQLYCFSYASSLPHAESFSLHS